MKYVPTNYAIRLYSKVELNLDSVEDVLPTSQS